MTVRFFVKTFKKLHLKFRQIKTKIDLGLALDRMVSSV